MKVTINHDLCKHGGFFSDRCMAATIRNPLGHELSCMAAYEDDGKTDLTVNLIEDGKEYQIVLHNQTEQDQEAMEVMSLGAAALKLRMT